MPENYRKFQAGPDPFGRVWDVEFRWLQTGISIRHADTVDVKFAAGIAEEPKHEKVIALRHPDLLQLASATGHPLTDGWCIKLAALHLIHMIDTADDMEKILVTVEYPDLAQYASALKKAA
jgi:hypothetical protein